MVDEKTLALVIGSSVAQYPTEVKNLLFKYKIYPLNSSLSNEQMVDGILKGLSQSESFRNEYSQWIGEIVTTLNVDFIDKDYYNFDWGGLVNNIAPALVGLGSSLIMNNQVRKDAIGQANAQQQALDTQYQIALQQQKNIELAKQQAMGNTTTKSNLPLYIGLGVGALVIVTFMVVIAVKLGKKQ